MTLFILGFIGFCLLVYFDSKSLEFKDSLKNKRHLKRNLSFGAASLVVMGLMSIISSQVKALVPNVFYLEKLPILDFLGCFLFAELLNWVSHYYKHVFSFLWKFHFQHHIDEKYTVWLTTHTHGLEVLISGTIMGILMSLIGFSQLAVNCYFLFYTLANTYQHSNANLSLGLLDYLIVSPRYHRIHHSKSYRANYGSTLTFWDLIFKTAVFPKRHEVVKDIGISNNGEPFGFWEEMVFFLPKKDKRNSSTDLSHNISRTLPSS